jgi:Flp pilus assembly protein TadG
MPSILRNRRHPISPADRTGRRGQSMVEFALILPVMLLLLAAAIDLGRLFYAYVAVENAAKEGAFFGARNPLCDDGLNTNCDDPNNVLWHVRTEAPNLGSQFTTTIACRDNAGTLMQPITNCLDGMKYQVTVTYPFKLITPILSSILGSGLTLHAESQATVISDAFDPSGLEVLVWVNTLASDNAAAITSACTPSDSVTSPGFYYQPCQDTLNVDTYLQFQENATVSYKVRVRNTGNISLANITYGWTTNGVTTAVPGTCGSLPTAIVKGGAASYCTFTKTAVYNGTSDFAVAATAQGDAQGLPTGQTTGAAVVHITPAPRLAITLLTSPYRLGQSGNGTLGFIDYTTGDLTLNRNTASVVPEIQNPTGWFYFKVVNQGGAAANFSASVTQAGSPVLPASCVVPSSLAASGQAGSTFSCVFPRTFNATQAYAFVGSANATNAIIVAGTQKTLTLTTATCSGGQLPIPNLVDTLNPTADGTNKTVLQAKTAWPLAGFIGALTTTPAAAANNLSAITQNRLAYSCMPTNTTVVVGAQ